jgi:hypothetical protein
LCAFSAARASDGAEGNALQRRIVRLMRTLGNTASQSNKTKIKTGDVISTRVMQVDRLKVVPVMWHVMEGSS